MSVWERAMWPGPGRKDKGSPKGCGVSEVSTLRKSLTLTQTSDAPSIDRAIPCHAMPFIDPQTSNCVLWHRHRRALLLQYRLLGGHSSEIGSCFFSHKYFAVFPLCSFKVLCVPHVLTQSSFSGHTVSDFTWELLFAHLVCTTPTSYLSFPLSFKTYISHSLGAQLNIQTRLLNSTITQASHNPTVSWPHPSIYKWYAKIEPGRSESSHLSITPTTCASIRKTTISILPARIPGLTSFLLRLTANEIIDVQEGHMNGTS